MDKSKMKCSKCGKDGYGKSWMNVCGKCGNIQCPNCTNTSHCQCYGNWKQIR
jgi:hypothetical protein